VPAGLTGLLNKESPHPRAGRPRPGRRGAAEGELSPTHSLRHLHFYGTGYQQPDADGGHGSACARPVPRLSSPASCSATSPRARRTVAASPNRSACAHRLVVDERAIVNATVATPRPDPTTWIHQGGRGEVGRHPDRRNTLSALSDVGSRL
jgi:hypothetical protein